LLGKLTLIFLLSADTINHR